MKITDPIGDMITRIRNGQMRGLKKVSVPGSKLRKAVLDVLHKEGFIQEYTVSKDKSFETIEINLKYMYGDPVIKEIERVSRPGRRIYSRSDSIQKIQNGLGISIILLQKEFFLITKLEKKNLVGRSFVRFLKICQKLEKHLLHCHLELLLKLRIIKL